jgi:3,5-epimerase/4-reductase
MKFLIYGSKGWIGGLFMDYLTNTPIEFIEGTVRVDSPNLEKELRESGATNVISFIGRTHGVLDDGTMVNTIDYLEYPGKLYENIRDNLFGPMMLAELCTKLRIHYTYLGTGCIFDCDTEVLKPESFSESSLPNYFGSSYSMVKGFTDRLMHSKNVLNLRIRMPISSVRNDRNFITKISKYSRICSIPNSMTVLDDFFPIFVDLMTRGAVGTYNCTNPGLISHNEILKEYSRLVDPKFEWENFTQEEQSLVLKSSRSNNLLDTGLIELKYPDLMNIKDSVTRILEEYL